MLKIIKYIYHRFNKYLDEYAFACEKVIEAFWYFIPSLYKCPLINNSGLDTSLESFDHTASKMFGNA